eukprot:SAG11_NODE_10055_length_860_cov_1.871222_1_plen_276_part_10
MAGTYTFRFHADYGLGSFIGVDGAETTPVLAGYRTCLGEQSETNIWKCPYCGNRGIASVPGQQLNGGQLDMTICALGQVAGDPLVPNCCPAEGDNSLASATALRGCTHSLDQGAICYTHAEGVDTIAPTILQCHGYGSTQGAGNQAVVFGCIDFWTAYCPAPETTEGVATYDGALAKFAECTLGDVGDGYTVPQGTASWNGASGYCHGALQNAQRLSNQDVCNTASNVDIGFHIRIPFTVNTAGAYTFRFHADYGLGSFIGVDGAEHTPGNTWGHQ